jgi:hypothetical protein
MSRSTEILISTAHSQKDPLESILMLLRLTGAEEAFIASRTVGISHDFETYLAFARGEADDPEEQRVLLGYDVPADKLPSLYREGTCLILDLSNCPLVESIGTAVQASIPAEDLGEFFIGRVYLLVGEHDVFDINSSNEATYLGRYSLTLKLQSDGTPTAPEAVRNQILALGEFQDVLARFETEFGPAQVAFLYLV